MLETASPFSNIYQSYDRLHPLACVTFLEIV